MQPFRGAGKVQFLRNRDEIPEVPQFQIVIHM
jgi:hypothetical protein